jgi:hypothetical protein
MPATHDTESAARMAPLTPPCAPDDAESAARIAPLEPPCAPEVEAMLRRWMPRGFDVAPGYRLLAYVMNGAGIQREPWAARFPAAAPLP